MDSVILEGLVTTLNSDGTTRIAPMGPTVDGQWEHFLLRPFSTLRTLANLKRTGQGVLHVTDNVEQIARAAIGKWDHVPAMDAATFVDGNILQDCCRWYEFRVPSIDDSHQRAELDCVVVSSGRNRDFAGFCRAKHAVVEAAILATRIAFLDTTAIKGELQRLEPLVEKTGGTRERQAFDLLRRHIDQTMQ